MNVQEGKVIMSISELRVTYTSASMPRKCREIFSSAKKGSLTFNSIIQRALVWDNTKKSKLIESILLGRDVPAIHLIRTEQDAPDGCKKGSKIFDCIDGKQRCNTIIEFMDNNLELQGVIEELNGKKYEDLDDEDKSYFDNYIISAKYYMDIDEKETATLMACLNNGKSLTGIEKSRICAKDMSNLIVLANHPFFTRILTEKSISSRHNEDLLIKTQLIKDGIMELSNKQITKYYEEKEFTAEEISEISGELDNMNLIYDELEKIDIPKRKILKLKSRIHLLSIMSLTSQINASPALIAKFLVHFFSGEPTINEEYNASAVSGTNHAVNVLTRIETIMEEWNKYIRTE